MEKGGQVIGTLESLDFSSGSYFSGQFELKIRKQKLQSCYGTFVWDPQKAVEKTLTPEEAKQLTELLNSIQVLGWKRKYSDLGVLDGFSWSLTLVYDHGQRKKTEGYVATPDGFDQLEDFFYQLADYQGN